MTTITEANGVVTFRLAKSYDALHDVELQKLETEIVGYVQQLPQPRLVFDFSDTSYISSSFVEVIMRGWKRLQEKNGRMALCRLNSNCATVLKVCRLDRIWEIRDTYEQALECVNRPAE